MKVIYLIIIWISMENHYGKNLYGLSNETNVNYILSVEFIKGDQKKDAGNG